MRLTWLTATALVLALGAAPALASSLSSKIRTKQHAVDSKKGREGVLTADIHGLTSRVDSLQANITVLQSRETRIQADLDAKLHRLSGIQGDLRGERARLVRLRARLKAGRAQLAQRLVELYKADNPDLLGVVLNADGFAHLIEDAEFAARIGRQDNRIITAVTSARAESETSAKRLADLEDDATQTAQVVQDQRDQVAAVRGDLETTRDQFANARSQKSTLLASVRTDREDLEGDLEDLQAQEAKIQARLAGVSTASVGPVRTGSSGLIWPVNGPIVSGFGTRWGRLHAGVDIAVASGTPVRAAQTGSVRIAGWVSGYGNYVCIQHQGALSTCYGHNTSLAVHVGQSVAKGQVISSSGCTGHCFGPHVHFETRINGTPTDPMAYL